jgi:hypothetical protein
MLPGHLRPTYLAANPKKENGKIAKGQQVT